MLSFWFALKAAGGFAYFGGLGALLLIPAARRAGRTDGKTFSSLPFAWFPLALTTGLVANYFLVLVFQSLWTSLAAGVLLACAGWAGALAFGGGLTRMLRSTLPRTTEGWTAVALFGLLVGVYAIRIFTDPIMGWDAQAIWFFHGRMIYLNGALSQAAGWSAPSIAFSHPDYPKLFPALAAQVSFVLGYWNEISPKLALFYLFVPALGWVFQFFRFSLSFAVLLLVLPFGLGMWLWNGYMDGYLAFYFAAALLLLGRYIRDREPLDWVGAGVCLLLITGLKHEGLLGLAVGASGLVLAGVVYNYRKLQFTMHHLRLIMVQFLKTRVYWLPLLPGVGSVLLWQLYQQAWGPLANDLAFGSPEGVSRGVQRVIEGGPLVEIGRAFFPYLLLPGLVILVLFFWRRFSVDSLSALLMLSTAMYLAVLGLVYLMTPMDLTWHLATSAERTLLAPATGFWVAIYFALMGKRDTSIGI